MKKLLGLVLALMCSLSISADRLFMVGDATPQGWNTGESEMQATELIETAPGIFTWSGKLKVGGEGFKVSDKMGDWGAWRPAVNGTIIDGNEDALTNGADYKWKVSEAGIYTVTINWNTKKISAVKETYTLAKDGEGYYLLGTAEDLFYFSQWVNHGAIALDSKAKLTADIDFSAAKYKYASIGVAEYEGANASFRGEFNGQGHTIKIAIESHRGRTGLFAYVRNASIKNLVVEGTSLSSEKNCVGGLGGRVDGGVTVQNVIVKTAVSYTGSNGDATCGGFFANMEGNSTLTNCAFLGSISTGNSNGNGGLVGWAGSGTNNKYTNCLVAPTAFDQSKGDQFARNNPTKTNCYFVASNDARFATGELCFLLNNKVSGGEDWYQNIGTDTYPVPFASHAKVYANGALDCAGNSKGGAIVYSNSEGGSRDPHTFVDGFCSACHEWNPDGMTATEGWYEISKAWQLRWVAEAINEHNSTYGNKNYKLTADVDYSAYTDQAAMMGKPSNTFKGTFDGQCHTVTVAFNNTSADETALFRRINGGTVKNLKVDGTITTNKSFAGGIVSGIWQTGTIQNCEAAVTINDEATGDGTHGGILARMNDNNAAGTNITNCLFSGELNIPNRTGSGAIIGWPNYGSSNVHVKNCLVTGTLNMKSGSDNDVICRNEADVQNCYYINLQGANNSKSATAATAAQAESGELTYLLNGSVNGGENWFQKKGVDNVPTPFATGDNKIYANGTQYCDGSAKATTYDNTDKGLVKDEHVFAANNLCKNCHKAGQEPSNVDGTYQIATIGHLVWFSDHVNGGSTTAAADVTADIEQGEAIYTPIGSAANPYKGVFKGGFHTITLALNNSDYTNQGIFGILTGGAEIYNLTAAGTVSASSAAGGIAGSTNGSGDVQFINVGNEAAVTTTGNNAGGILGVDMGSAAHIKMINCYNAGTIKGASDNGGLSGWAGDNPDIINCYNIAEVTNGDAFLRCNGNKNFVNTYGKDQATPIAASGELCYKLGDKNFRQTIGAGHPVFDQTLPNVGALTVGSAGYATYVAPYNFSAPENVEVSAAQVMGNGVHLEPVSEIPAGTAVVLTASEGTTYYNSIASATLGTTNDLIAATADVIADGTQYALAKKTQGVGFYKVQEGLTIKEGKAYLVMSNGIQDFYGFDDDETSINSVDANVNANEAVFNIAGQRVEKAQKGIYIINGKKVLVK